MIASSRSLRTLYGAIYPPDGSYPTHPEAARYREDPVALTQLLLSLMIQLAEAQEQGIKDAATLARAVAEVAQGGTVATPDSGGGGGAGAEVSADAEVMMPTVSATTTPFVPATVPMSGPMMPAPNGGGSVTVAPFQPANVSAPAAQ